MESFQLAVKLCFDAHKNQIDKSGMPYVFHLAEQMQGEESIIVELLHDIIEDTNYTLDYLYDMGFSKNIIAAINLMTHEDDVPHMDYM